MAGAITPGNLERIISQAIQQATEELIAEEEKLAIERVRKRMHEAKASIIMAVMTSFDVERNQRQIIIRVHDTTGGHGNEKLGTNMAVPCTWGTDHR